MSHMDLYERLGFENNTPTEDEIKRRYRILAKNCHPDKYPNDETKKEEFRIITEAYEILSNKEKRSAYDNEGSTDFSEENRINQSAVQFLNDLLINLLEQVPEHILEHNDLRDVLIKNVNENISHKNKEFKGIESNLRKFKTAQKRFKRKTKENSDIFARALEDRAAVLISQLKVLAFITKVLDRMNEILNDYTYDFTTREPFQNSNKTHAGAIRLTFRSN